MFEKTYRAVSCQQVHRLLVLSAAAVVLNACVGVTNGSLPDTFTLTQTSSYAALERKGRRQLLIAEPAALKTLDSEQIVVRTSDAAVQFLSDAQWNDRLPKILQNKLLTAFENTGQLAGVGLPGEGLAIDHQLLVTIRSFEIIASSRAGTPAEAQVELSVKILNDRNGVVRANRVFDAVQPISGHSNAAYINALNMASGAAVMDIVNWALPYVR